MKIKTADLTGEPLRFAVAKAEGVRIKLLMCAGAMTVWTDDGRRSWHLEPDTDWAQGGPIIERELIDIVARAGQAGWAASGLRCAGSGPTPLVAAMRCFVVSKLGDEVEVPEELVS